jgi:hypothetical protein
MKKWKPGSSQYQGLVPPAERININPDGTLDEIVVGDVQTFHLEQMNTCGWWIGLTLANGKDIHINLWSKAAVYARADDESGA